MIDHKRLGVNILKLVWNGELADGGENVAAQVRQVVEEFGEGNTVLCRCDNREAIEFGRSVGINTFQGRYVENLIAEDGRRRDLLKLKRRIERAEQEEAEAEEEA